jgi:shikimate 5-dehydrogenase
MDEVKWVEISTRAERERFTALSTLLKESGVQNQVSFIECGEEEFGAVLTQAMRDYDQVRIGGHHKQNAYQCSTHLPASVQTLKVVDAFVKGKDGEWWPRCFLGDAIMESISEDMTKLDFTGAILVIGAGADARAAVSAFVRVGFNRFNITDESDDLADAAVADLRRSFFNVQFNHVPRHMITQLPSIHSVAINTVSLAANDGIMTELSYFNFLKPGGVWLDLPLEPGAGSLDTEARNVGAMVEPASFVYARSDRAWCELCFGVVPSATRYRELLNQVLQSK